MKKEINWQKLAFEYQTTGISLTELGKREGIDRRTISKHLKELGIKIINRQNIVKFNENIFDCIDTEEKAYWLGFIFADGSIRSNGSFIFELSLKGSDINHLHKFNKFMGHIKDNVKIGKVTVSGKSYTRCRWNISNKHLWNTLNKYGCTPRKSLTLTFPDISIFKNKNLIRHFIRGYFDGDGCLTRHINKTIVTPVASILGTYEFLDSIIKYIGINGNIRHDHRHSDNTFSIEFNKIATISFINYIYNNSTIYLDRKYKLYDFFKNGSRSVEEFTELLSGNIGENLVIENTEINSKIAKGFESSYSVVSE